MQQAQQIAILKELQRQLDEGENADAGEQYRVPTSIYADPALAEQEWNAFFKGHPQFIALSDMLPEPHSFLTINDFGVPILATRDADGTFRAFLNACRHRATRVEMEERGNRKLFVCPFHAWSYSSDGRLVSVAREDHFGEVDKSCNGLVELPSAEVAGMLWVHPEPGGDLDVEALLGTPLLEELAHNGFHNYRYTGCKTIDARLNWKLANDTFGETYHFQRLHKNTLGQLYFGHNTHFEPFGRNHRFVTANLNLPNLAVVPEADWRIQEAGFIAYYIFPNIQFIWTGSNVYLIRIYPDAANPGRSITRVACYFTPEAFEAAGAADDQMRDQSVADLYDGEVQDRLITPESMLEVFNSTIRDEDYVMGEFQQQAAESGIAGWATFGRNEPILHHFHRSFRDALNLPRFEDIEESQVETGIGCFPRI